MKIKLKEKALSVLEKLNDKKTSAAAAAVTAAPALMSAGVSAAESGGGTSVTIPTIADSVNSDMLNAIITQITALLPVCLPAVVGLLAFRKGISFLIGMLRGA